MANRKQNSGPEANGAVDESGGEAETCLICLDPMTNRSLTDTCLHSFCLQCLNEWSQTHNICPFCRRVYRNILGNYVSQNQFDLIAVPYEGVQPQEAELHIPGPIRTLSDQMQSLRHYNTLQEQHYLHLYEQLNHLDENSIEYLQTMQRIVNLEDRLESNRQRIAMLGIDLRNAIIQHQQQITAHALAQHPAAHPAGQLNQQIPVNNDSDGSDRSDGSQASDTDSDDSDS